MYEYRVLVDREEMLELYLRMKEERLLWAMFPEIAADEWSEDMAVAILNRPDMLVLAGYAGGELAGFLTLAPLRFRGKAGEVAVLAFRDFFVEAVPLCRGAFRWIFKTQECDALIGWIPVASRHSLRMFSRLGFKAQGRIPNMYWYAKIGRFVDAETVMLTREDFENGTQSEHAENSGAGADSGKVGDEAPERGSAGGDRSAAAEGKEEPGAGGVDPDNKERRRPDLDHGRQRHAGVTA